MHEKKEIFQKYGGKFGGGTISSSSLSTVLFRKCFSVVCSGGMKLTHLIVFEMYALEFIYFTVKLLNRFSLHTQTMIEKKTS